MPKIIVDLEKRIVEETRRQISEKGVEAVKVRDIASALGIANGTLYNYFPSKDAIVSRMVINDWNLLCGTMEKDAMASTDVRGCLVSIFTHYASFHGRYARFLRDFRFTRPATYSMDERHSYLVGVLSGILLRSLAKQGIEAEPDLAWMFGQIVLDVNNENRDFMPFVEYFERMIKENSK